MRCLKCGGEIPSNLNICPYCGQSIQQSINERMVVDERLKIRFAQIDEEFGMNVDYVVMNTQKLNEFFNDIYGKFLKLDTNDHNIQSQLTKIMNHLASVDEELQNRFAERGAEPSNLGFVPFGNIVFYLLDKCNPPEVNCAAYKIRSSTERLLKDHYNFPYGIIKTSPNGRKTYGFKKPYPEMFKSIAKNPYVAYQMFKDHLILNRFVHEGEENDRFIAQIFPTKEDQKRFLKSAYELRKKYNLV